MTLQDSVRRVERCLGQEIETASRLLAVLGEEHAALQSDDTRALENAVAAKQELAARLEALGRERDAETRGSVQEDTGQWLGRAGHGEDSALHGLWLKLQSLARDCHKQNRINGAVVEVSQRHVQHVLALLQGQAQPTEVYGRNGTTSKAPSSTTFAKA
jgi:flagellar biosynthesis/type III secretory pathway chaperone